MTEYRSPSGRYVRWPDLIADARKRPGLWLTAFRNSPADVVRTIRLRRHLALRHDDGRLVAEARNVYVNPDTGTEYGDIYVRWVQNQET